MNKKEFLQELEKRIQGLPKKDMDDRLSFYEEMIEDRILEGKSEESAIEELGSIEEIVNEIAKDTPLTKLVKQKIKPQRKIKTWEIILFILGSPLWFALSIVALVLIFVFYLLIWILVIVSFIIEISFIAASLLSLIAFFGYIYAGEFNLLCLGGAILFLGLSILWIFPCINAVKVTLKLSKKIMNYIKSSIIKKGK